MWMISLFFLLLVEHGDRIHEHVAKPRGPESASAGTKFKLQRALHRWICGIMSPIFKALEGSFRPKLDESCSAHITDYFSLNSNKLILQI